MPNPATPRSRSTFLLLVLVSATVLVLGSTPPLRGVRSAAADALSPVRSFGSAITSPLRDWFGSVDDYKRLRTENERLRDELDTYRGKAAQFDDAIRERREVLSFNKLEVVNDIPSVLARVSGASLSNFENTVEIDRGSNDGIAAGMPVVTGAGLVGRVLSVNRASARIVLMNDADSRTGVRLSRSGVVGVAVGSAPDQPLTITGIEPDAVVEPGDQVVTAGLPGARFPAGIPVGTIRSATIRPGALEQELTLDPLAELGSMTFVRVLLWLPPSPPPDVPPTLATIPADDGGAPPSTGTAVDDTTRPSLDPSNDPLGDPTPVSEPGDGR